MKKVDYWKLLEKAKNQYGITGKLGKRHHNFLHNRKQPILVEEITPLETKVVSGAVQGSILGPIWFQIFIGDLTQNKTASTKFFVDDAQIKKRVMAGEEDVEDLQSNLDTLYTWEKRNKMKFNGTKFQLLRYGPNENIKKDTLYFTSNMEEVINQFSSLRDLGIIMSDDAKFSAHIDKVTTKVRQKVGWVLRTFYTRRTDVLKQLWKTLIQCHIDYCSQLYMPSQSNKMQSLENYFMTFHKKSLK